MKQGKLSPFAIILGELYIKTWPIYCKFSVSVNKPKHFTIQSQLS